jgi:hypothetical protein
MSATSMQVQITEQARQREDAAATARAADKTERRLSASERKPVNSPAPTPRSDSNPAPIDGGAVQCPAD